MNCIVIISTCDASYLYYIYIYHCSKTTSQQIVMSGLCLQQMAWNWEASSHQSQAYIYIDINHHAAVDINIHASAGHLQPWNLAQMSCTSCIPTDPDHVDVLAATICSSVSPASVFLPANRINWELDRNRSRQRLYCLYSNKNNDKEEIKDTEASACMSAMPPPGKMLGSRF